MLFFYLLRRRLLEVEPELFFAIFIQSYYSFGNWGKIKLLSFLLSIRKAIVRLCRETRQFRHLDILLKGVAAGENA